MNTFKKVGVLATLVLASSFASAATFNLGDLTNTASSTITGSIAAGSFSDIFNFTLTQDTYFSALASGAPTSIIEFTLIGVNGILGTTGVNGIGFSTAELATAPSFLASGNYSLSIEGIAGAGSTGYSLNTSYINSTITSPIPEPSSIALMLGGLGLIGFMAARRKKA